MRLEIGFFGSLMGVGPTCGYGYAATQLIEAWQRQRVPVWWGKENAPIAFSMCQPDFYDGTKNQLKIGYTPWESTTLPPGWIETMNQMDEIWTPSEACVDWYKWAGVIVPIKVLHHGINRSHYPLRKRSLREGQPFTFLHIGEPTPRKGGNLVMNAFTEVFGDRQDVKLIMKGDSILIPRPASNIEQMKEVMTQEELTQLYLSCHAMVYPTNGEGFGLIPFQAAATGMPTLVTDWGGCKEYIKYCWPLRNEKTVACQYEPHTGYWATPSYDDICYWMEDVVGAPNYFFTKGYMRGQAINEKWSWDSIAKQSLKWMKESLDNRS